MCEMSYSYSKFQEMLKKTQKTVAQVARETGISESVFSNWKNRGGNLSLENTAKIAKVLGVSSDYFINPIVGGE